MAHVADTPPPHSLVAMPPHAWSTERQQSASQNHRLSLPSYPTSSSMYPHHLWNSSHQHNIHQLQPSVPSDLTPPTDRPDHLNADTIFRDLLNLRIASDTSPDSSLPPQPPHLPHQTHRMSAQIGLNPGLVRRDLFSHSDPDPDQLDILDHFDHSEQSLKHFPSQLSAIPFLQHHLQQQQHDPSLTDPLSIPHRASFAPHGPFSSTPLVSRRHSSHAALYRTSSISDQSPRTSTSSRSHAASVPSHSGPRIKNDLYKTEICRSFAENAGFCKYGSKCQFAHGEEELRPVRRHPRYKTKLCRNFVNNGSCPYDTRCRFIHANDLPFVSATTLSGLHQTSVSTTQGSGISEHACYDSADPAGDDYAEHLRRILSLTPGSSAPSMSANGELSIPISSPHASPPAESDTGHVSQDTSREKLSHRVAYGGQTGKHGDPGLPTDRVYHASANVFRDYPDNAFCQPYIPLVSGEPDTALGSSTRADDGITAPVGTLRETRVTESDDISTVFSSAEKLSVTEVFATGSKTLSIPTEGMKRSASVQDATSPPRDDDASAVTTTSKPAPPKGTRCRLPVFRNITSDGDSV